MDERNFELIDKYLRREMTPEERLNFEQEALNNPELRRETELTYRIKRSLANRQQKLHRTAHCEIKKKYKIAGAATAASIAAVLAVGFFLTKPAQITEVNSEIIAANTSVNAPETLKKKSEEAIVTVKKSISEGKEEVAIAEVTKLEDENIIPTLSDVSAGKFVVSHHMETEDADVLSQDAYELHWLKIRSLIAIGKKEEAIQLLMSFVQIEGIHKAAADSLLQKMK